MASPGHQGGNGKIEASTSRPKVGDKVMRFSCIKVSRSGSKMEEKWSGPYLMSDINEEGQVTLKTLGGVPLSITWNIKYLKLYEETGEISSQTGDDKKNCKSKPTRVKFTASPHVDSQVVANKKTRKNTREHLITDNNEWEFIPVDLDWQISKCNDLEIIKKHKAVETKVISRPKDVIPIRGDGNCFFRCISYAITGSQAAHKQIRNDIVSFMKDKPRKIQNHFGKKYLVDSRMEEDGTWATEAEILATAAYLNTDIRIFAKSGKQYRWLNYSRTTLGRGSRAREWRSIYLTNEFGVHFNYVGDVLVQRLPRVLSA